jgi:hypothetical protein
MRRAFWIVPFLLVIALAVPIGVGIYHAGVNAGVDQAATSTQVVRVVGGPGYGYGFFPFGLFLFPLFLFGFFAIARAARWRHFGGPGGHGHGGHDDREQWGPGPWGKGGARVEEWHRHLHEAQSEDPKAERAGP